MLRCINANFFQKLTKLEKKSQIGKIMTLGYEVLYVETGINRGEQESDNICSYKKTSCM
jgi:hypothetical protein